jgi:phosphoglycolate phosphatase
MKFKLIVFDWDGTLMDSEARIVACIRAAASDLGLPVPTKEASSEIIGLGLKEALSALFGNSDELFMQRMIGAYRRHFLDSSATPSKLFPGAAEVVWELERQGYLLAVATGKGRQGLDHVLAETGLGGAFHVTRCSDEAFSKPHPEMLLQIIAFLGVEPHETLMIGDTEYDMEMAVNAGTQRLAVSYGVHASQRLLRHQPLGCLDEIGELTGWLERFSS